MLAGRWRLNDALVSEALCHIEWPGRWQRTEFGGRLLVLDASHNAEGAQMLDANLARLAAQTGRAPLVVIGVLGVARARPLVETVCRHAREIHFVVPNQGRACSHAQLEALVPAWYRGRIVRSTIENLFPSPGVGVPGEPNDPLVVTGSIYLLGEVIGRLDPNRGPLESSLQDF